MEVAPDGFFTEIWSINKKNEKVFPYMKSKKNTSKKGFDVTLTGRKEDYQLVGLREFLDLIHKGAFSEVGRVRMKPRSGGPDGGFSVRKATFSEKLVGHLAGM